MSSQPLNIAIMGAGPAGYPAAFLAADLGMKVTLISTNSTPGGVCLYCGCVPSKALLHAAKTLTDAKEAKDFGIDFGEPNVDINVLRKWKNDVILKLTTGLGQLTKQRNINYIHGRATFVDSHTLKIVRQDKSEETLSFDKIVIATGSQALRLPFVTYSNRIIDSIFAQNIKNIPESLLVVGGGYIGLELGSVYAALGSQVSIVEMMDEILPHTDRDFVRILEKRLKKNFTAMMLGTKVTKMEENPDAVSVTFENKKGETETKNYEKVLISIGRKPNSEDLGLENTQVKCDDKGFIQVNPNRQTDDPDIFAIGDVAGQPMLAHKATHEGRMAIEAINGKDVAFNPKAIPAVVYTDPEIAWCGLTEAQAKRDNRDVRVAKFPWMASGRAVTLNRVDGLTKLIIDPKTEKILGVGMAGSSAGDLISEGVLAVEMGATANDLKRTIHPHPTLSETLMETAESFYGFPIHIPRPKK